MKHTYTEEQKERIAQMLFDFLTSHHCWGGDHFSQNDECQIDSIDLMCELADIKDVTDKEGRLKNYAIHFNTRRI